MTLAIPIAPIPGHNPAYQFWQVGALTVKAKAEVLPLPSIRAGEVDGVEVLAAPPGAAVAISLSVVDADGHALRDGLDRPVLAKRSRTFSPPMTTAPGFDLQVAVAELIAELAVEASPTALTDQLDALMAGWGAMDAGPLLAPPAPTPPPPPPPLPGVLG